VVARRVRWACGEVRVGGRGVSVRGLGVLRVGRDSGRVAWETWGEVELGEWGDRVWIR